jgi:transcriptional regulator with XRE-family HTH domain
MADKEMRPSEVFAARLRETRQARGLSQSELARQMTDQGRPLSKAALLRIENGQRGLSLDEAMAISAILRVAPALMLSPADDDSYVWLTDKEGVNASAIRSFLRFGDALRLTTDGQRDRLSEELERRIVMLANALMDADRTKNVAARRDALVALADTAAGYREALEGVDDAK